MSQPFIAVPQFAPRALVAATWTRRPRAAAQLSWFAALYAASLLSFALIVFVVRALLALA